MIITIDGPSGSGKSTVAQKIAQQLHIFYLNTGLLYRALAYFIFEDVASPLYKKHDTDLSLITRSLLQQLPSMTYAYAPSGASISVQGNDMTAHCYATAGIDQIASKLSALPVVREFLLDVQRDIAKLHDVVADGRDCGTVVFPHAQHKFFLTASLDVRAQRRMHDVKIQELGLSIDVVRDDLAQRDERDKNRAIAPLRVPENAIMIDSSNLSIDEVAGVIIEHVYAAA